MVRERVRVRVRVRVKVRKDVAAEICCRHSCSLFSYTRYQSVFFTKYPERIRRSASGESLEDTLKMAELSQWPSLEFSVLSSSTVQPFISIFGLCLTRSLLCNIQPFLMGLSR